MSALATQSLKVSRQMEVEVDDLGWFTPVIKLAKEMKATDIYAVEGKASRIGILKNYTIVKEDGEATLFKPSRSHIEALMEKTMSADMIDMSFLLSESPSGNGSSHNYHEYGFSVKNYGRYRVSCTTSEEGMGLSLRKLPYTIPSLDELDRYEFLKGVKDMLNFKIAPPNGLILHTGITGSGKSTTIASELDHIASKISGNILIFENPIEYQITMRPANVRHYEVNRHISSFVEGMKLALRNDPSVIMIGEVRTRDEIQALFEVASKGHLVFSTLHTSNVMNTMRFLDEVGDNKGSWRQLVASSLRAIVSQKLVYRNGEYTLIAEVFIPNTSARSLVAEGKYTELENMITGNQLKDNGTITFKTALDKLVEKNVFAERERKEFLNE
ncbi:MAG: type IV pilus twitching motility protein PilT [Thermodesulfovibrionales bacterium]